MDMLHGLTPLLAAAEEHAAKSGEGAHHGLSWVGLFVYVGFVLVVLFAILANAKGGLKARVFTNKWTQVTEHLYHFISNMAVGIIGPHGRKYVPMMMTFWMVIFLANIVSLFFPAAPTADLGFNLALALIAIGYVQWEGIKANGFFGHFGHFAGPKLSGPLIFISLMIFVIEIISELMKNLSLSLRIYGNIEGGHKAGDAMNLLGAKLGGLPWLNIPFGAFLLPVKLLTCVVQAMLFTLLTCVYLSLVTHHEHDDEHADGHAPAHAH